MVPTFMEALALKMKLIRTGYAEQDLQHQQASKDVQDYLETHYTTCGVIEWSDLAEGLYNPSIKIMQGTNK